MKNIRTLIVDDEPIAQEILETFVLKTPVLELAGKSKNALEAFYELNRLKIDLMLLDINMPEIDGMSFLKSLKNPPLVIFTTAYSEFAAESYNHNAIDYLLKPIAFDRFEKAIEKAVKALAPKTNDSTEKEANVNAIYLKAEGKLVRVDIDNFWMAEGMKDYVTLRIEDKKLIVHTTMKNLQDLLGPYKQFIRVHKSYIVNLRFVNEADKNAVKVKEIEVPVGSTFKDELEAALRGLRNMKPDLRA